MIAVIRILSIKDKADNIKLFRPILQIPQNNSILSYLQTGALVVKIEIKTGYTQEVIQHYRGDFNKEFFMPSIQTIEIPFWEEMKNQIYKIHNILDEIPLIGWDIVITPNGFSFLEGNLSPSLDVHQKYPFTPFINSDFYKLFLYHLENSEI